MTDISLPVKVFRVKVGKDFAYRMLDGTGKKVPYADRFLDRFDSGTARTYAYALVDCFRWIAYESLRIDEVELHDLERYMTSCVRWSREGSRPAWTTARKSASPRTLQLQSTAISSYFRYVQSLIGGNAPFQFDELKALGMQARRQLLLGHIRTRTKANPLSHLLGLTPRSSPPRLPSTQEFEHAVSQGRTLRDRALMRWLLDGGFRIGELVGLHFVDIHLSPESGCGEAEAAHVHICDRRGLANEARSKSKNPWSFDALVIKGGSVRFLSPAMIHTLFEYVTEQLPPSYNGPMVFVTMRGEDVIGPLSAEAARAMISRAGRRAGIEGLHPHLFRHRFATDVTRAAGGNSAVTKLAGGWRSAATVEQVYNHPSLDAPELSRALDVVWGTQR